MRYAYVTFLMGGDGYLPGALVLAYSLKMQTEYDCVCLVTKDVSHRARHALGLVYDYVIPINELRIKSDVGRGRKDRNILMTRFEALRLGHDGDLGLRYDKIILLDADILPLCGYDELFQLPAPAGILMERKEECYCGASADSFEWSWHKSAPCTHGEFIPKNITDRVGYDLSNMGVNAGLWVLSPSFKEYNDIVAALHRHEIMALTKEFPWPEMQLATLIWSGRWTNVDIRYASIGGYPCVDMLYGIHFAGLKPWQITNRSAQHYAKFPDFTLWRQYFMWLYWSRPGLHDYPVLKRLCKFCQLL